jgi:NAD(P)-dependent dehydrogenase (short-subunit alcohol dehydrogenase family)
MKRTSKGVVLTGVSRGLGLAMAEAFIERGHAVIGCARSGDVLKKLQHLHPKPNSFSTG